MDFPEGMFLREVADHPDLVEFTFPFSLEGKAETGIVEELEDGDLIIDGWAASFDGIDRQGENFIPGAFQRGIKAFLEGSAPLCYHHKPDHVLGKVLALEEIEGKGLRMRARVDGAIRSHPVLGTLYTQIKRGTLKNLSVGGYFKRVATAAGKRIGDMDFTEISITGVPVHTKPAFSVVAGKALGTEPVIIPSVFDLSETAAKLDALERTLNKVEGKAAKGEPGDLEFLATLLELEQLSNRISTENEANEKYGSGGEPKGNEAVDALAKRVKSYLDTVAREAHALAAELGPLPSVSHMGASY